MRKITLLFLFMFCAISYGQSDARSKGEDSPTYISQNTSKKSQVMKTDSPTSLKQGASGKKVVSSSIRLGQKTFVNNSFPKGVSATSPVNNERQNLGNQNLLPSNRPLNALEQQEILANQEAMANRPLGFMEPQSPRTSNRPMADIIPTAGATETFTPDVGDHFFDPGGPGGTNNDGDPGNYPNCGCATQTTLLGVSELKFHAFRVFAEFDYLRIYDGADASGTLLYDNGTGGPNQGDRQLAEMITSHGSDIFTSSSGDFFFYFHASAVVNREGWDVEIMATGGGGGPFPDPYCGPLVFTNNVEPITLVEVAGISNRSDDGIGGSPAHEDFTAIVGQMEEGDTYTITLEGNTAGNFTSRFAVFIDWNQNGVLDDAGEVYEITDFLVNSTGVDNKQVSGIITVPAGVLAGETRMRVKKQFGSTDYLDPCMGTGYGQAEDYSIQVTTDGGSPGGVCANPIIEVNQDIDDTCMATIDQGGLAQSYIPTEESAAGAGIMFRDPSTGLDVTLSLWDGLPNAGGTMLASSTSQSSGDLWVDVFWDPVVDVTVGDTYYIVIDGDHDLPCVAGSTNDPYPGGNVFANNYDSFPTFDYTFRTYSCDDGTGGGNDCDEENPNDFTFENGFNTSSAASFRVANDVTVAADEDFTLTNITASIFANGGISNVDVVYYEDASGLPGAEIGSEASVTIDNQEVIGANFGMDVNEIELSVTPFVFNGQEGAPTTYWISLVVTDGSNTGSVFWLVTSSSMIGNPAAQLDGSWSIPDVDMDGVYIWEGQCDPISNDPFPAPYCGPLVFSTVEPITYVEMAGIANRSDAAVNGSPAHEDFTAVSGDVEQGETYTIALEGNTVGDWTNRFVVFIDWNQNGILDDAGEVYVVPQDLVNSTGTDGKQVFADIAVPADAVLGTTRMRVKKTFLGPEVDPCDAGASWGQAEDYTINVDEGLGISDVDALAGFSFYPNPSTDIVNLRADQNIESVSLYNLLGQQVFTTTVRTNSSYINISNLSTGTYIMKVSIDDQVGTYKLLKE